MRNPRGTDPISRRAALATALLAAPAWSWSSSSSAWAWANAASSPRADRTSSATCTLDALLSRRRVVRRFSAEDVSDAQIERLVSVAKRAPSAGHTQPAAFVLVRDRATRLALAEAALGQSFVAEAPVVLVACADLDRSTGKYGERGEQYALIDVAFASMLLLLAVVEEGLGACFVGAFRDGEVAQLIGLPPRVQPVAVIPIGHPAEAPRPQRLRKTSAVLHRERWSDRLSPAPRLRARAAPARGALPSRDHARS